MTLTEQPDQTFVLTLTTRERSALDFVTTKRGVTVFGDSINQTLKMFRAEQKAYEREQMQLQYDALTNAQRAQVDAILALAVLP